jgi:dephospho-CoA kinase
VVAIVHPVGRAPAPIFLSEHAQRGTKLVVLEIPLLFETGADNLVDVTIVVSAAPEVQRARLLQRPEMTAEKLGKLLARQMPDAQKRERADFVVDTSVDMATSQAALDAALTELTGRRGDAYARHWAA